MANEILEIILSSDEDSSSKVDLSVNSKEHVKYQNTGARTTANNKAVAAIPLRKNSKSITSISDNLMSNAEKKNAKDPVHTKSQRTLEVKQDPSINDSSGSKSKNSVSARTVLATSANKSYKNSSDFKANSTPLTQHGKKSSKGVDSNLKHVNTSRRLVQKNPRATARKSMHSPFSNSFKQASALDKTKWLITNNKSPTPVQSNLLSGPRQKEESETICNSSFKSPLFTPSSVSGLSVTPVSSSQQSNRTSVVNDVKASISIIKLNYDPSSQRKARKSLQNSKCMLPEHLTRTLSKAGVSITNISKDPTNNDVPNNVNSSVSNYNKKLSLENSSGLQTTILNSHNISNTHSNINRNEAQQRKSSCDTNSKSALRIISVDSQKNAKTDLKSGGDFKLAKNNEISLSVNPTSNHTDMDKKKDRRQNVKPSKSVNEFMRSEKETTQMNKNPTLSKTSSTQIHDNSEISIIRVPIDERLNSTSSNNNVKSSTKASDLIPIKPIPLSQAPQMDMSHKQFVSILPTNSKKRKLQNSGEQIKLQPKVNRKRISTSIHNNNEITLVQSSASNTPLDLSSKSSFTTNQERITSLKKSLLKLESNKTTKPLSNAKSTKETNSAAEFCEMNAQNLKLVESVSTDIEMKNSSIQRVADRQEISAQETTNSKLSLSNKLMENCLPNMKEDQTSKQRPPTKQVTSPKLSLKRKTNIVSEDDLSKKKNKVECIEEWNRPSTSSYIDIPPVELNGNIEERIPWDSSDDSSIKLKKLLDYCVPIMKKQEYYEPGEENKISKSLLKSLNSTKLSYASSNEFSDLLLDTFKDIKTKPQVLFQHLIKMKGTLAAYKCKRLKVQRSSISHSTSENPKVQPTSLKSSTPYKAPEISKVQPISLQSPISHTIPEKPKVQPATRESSISHIIPEIPKIQPVSLQSHITPEIQKISLISAIVHSTSEKVEPTSMKSSFVHNTPENPEVEPTSVKSSIVHNTPENPEVEPTSVKSIVCNTPEYLEVQSISLIPPADNSSEKVKPVSVKSPFVCKTSENPEVQTISLISSIVHTTSENAEPTSVKSSIEHKTPEYPEVQSIALISVHDTSEKVEPISMKSPIVCNTSEISNAQSTSSIAHNASKKVKCSSPSVLQTTKLERTCESPSGLRKSELSKFVSDPPHVELEKLDIPTSVIPIVESNFGESNHSSSKSRSDTIEAKLNERIKSLEKFLEKLHKKIKKLNARDFSLEEMDDDTAYVQEDRYKRKFLKVWDKLCSLKKCSTRFGRATEKHFFFTGTRYDQVNKAVERFINKRKPSDRFPNFNEIVDIIKKVNEVHDLGLPTRSVENIARDVFTDVGHELKRRRIKDYNKDFGCFLTDNIDFDDDPADHDENLNKVLTDSVSIGEKKIVEVIDKYANENVEDVGDAEDENIEGDVCETSFEEVKEKDNELPDTDPAIDSSDDEAKDSTTQTGFVASKRKDDCVVDVTVVSDASTEPDTSRVTDKDSLTVPKVFNNSPVIFASDIEIVEYPSEDDLISSSPDLPPLSEIISQSIPKTDEESTI